MVTAAERLTPAVRVRPSTRPPLLAACAVAPLVVPLVWGGFRISLLPDTVRATLSPLEAPWSVRDPLGVWALLLVLGWFAAAYRATNPRWWELPLVLLGCAVMLPRVGNAWLTAVLLTGPLLVRLQQAPGLVASMAIGLLSVCVTAVLLMQSRPAELPVEAAQVALSSEGGVFADWRWAPTLGQRAPNRPVLGSRGLAGESTEYWLDYLRVVQGHERWEDILRGWDVRVLMVQEDALAELVRASPAWRIRYDDGQTLVAERSGP